MKTTRRNFITHSALVAAGMACSGYRSSGATYTSELKSLQRSGSDGLSRICIFSKHFHGIDYDEMAAVVAEAGFDGIDLTVRPSGHVLPENAERDLPLAVDAAQKAGLKIYMIATDIVDADDKFTEPILRTASSLGIQHYRMGRYFYGERKSITQNLATIKSKIKALAKVNQKFKIHGEIQNHSGSGFGAPVWDLWEVFKNLDPRWIGVQYDILHATVEGANSWPLGFNLLKPWIKTLDIKDFYWNKENGEYKVKTTYLGEGMVDYKNFLLLLKENNIRGPFSIHYEYLTGRGGLQSKAEQIKTDLTTLRQWLNEAGL